MAHGMGLAGNTRICVLSCRSPDPGFDNLDTACVHSPSMAYGSTVLGVNGIYYNPEYRRRKIPTPIRRINSHNPHCGVFCHSPSVGDLGPTSGCFRGLQNFLEQWKLAYARSLFHDRTYWICLYFYRYVTDPNFERRE